MKIHTDPLFIARGEEEKEKILTTFYFLGKCCTNMTARYSLFGTYLMELRVI